jgi:hypothetical protein
MPTGIKIMQQRINDKVGYSLIHTFICNKLSDRAQGQLHYQLWQHNEDQSFGIALSKNESSGGFSAELITVNDIIQVLGKLYQDGKSFHATALKDLFIGKSVNNFSFLGAVLVDQQVIRPHAQTARLLEVNEDYELWSIGLESHLKTENDLDMEVPQDEITTTKKRHSKASEKIKMAVSTVEDVNEIHQE